MSAPIRIVIAEDQALVLGALAALLALESDISVIGQAADGEAALDVIRRLVPDVLLADVEMPGLSGIEVARRMRDEASPTRVILVSTFMRAGYLAQAQAFGVRGYLSKAAPAEALAAAIRTVHAGGVVIPGALAEAARDAGQDPLTAREREVLRLAELGQSNKAIGARLGLSPGTVRNYLAEAAAKLGARNRIEASRIARAQGWL